MFFDEYYLLLVLPAVILSLIAQGMVRGAFSKFSKVRSAVGTTGAGVATSILERNGVYDVKVEAVAGRLTDHYDPRKKVLRLSTDVFGSSSVAALGVAAHEAGHALQHAGKYSPLALRGALLPVANIGSNIGPYMAMAGFIFNIGILIDIGIILFIAAVLFYVITLPVEFNASGRALVELERGGVLNHGELAGAKKVLRAAAMTYLASALVAFASLARLILLRNRRRR
ncbi:MAG: zinc metallopeptidase [Oscillospiraceae bacterium]|nr:zinc metallopeptidase [Oscillospiraceae bacterium]